MIPTNADPIPDAPPGADPGRSEVYEQFLVWWGNANPLDAAWTPERPHPTMADADCLLFDNETQARTFFDRCTRPGTRLGVRTVTYGPVRVADAVPVLPGPVEL